MIRNRMQIVIFIFLVISLSIDLSAYAQVKSKNNEIVISDEQLKDKIRGGWTGQNIGVTYGGPTEFQYAGKIIPDSVVIPWYEGYIRETMLKVPGLYDDIYVGLTFLETTYKNGLNVHVDSLALAFAHASYDLDGANQVARYNILNGLKSPLSGYWKNNPHADDLDFQIAADFIGLMTPGMPNSASDIGDEVGHIMSYGDGWYGGVYVAAMYSLAFIQSDMNIIVKEALKTIPKKSEFYKCINDVIKWHEENPTNWKYSWQLLEDKWASRDLCPDGALYSFNITAKLNAAYVVLGLLYGEGDFGRTIDIATRAGQDSDCNPCTAGGILGTMLGYNNIPEYWRRGAEEAEALAFMGSISLKEACDMSFDLAKQLIVKNGGSQVSGGSIIRLQKPKPVRYEQSFEDFQALKRVELFGTFSHTESISFEGAGVVWGGGTVKAKKAGLEPVVFLVDVYLDGQKTETIYLPSGNLIRKRGLYWNFDLPHKKHTVQLKVQNPHPDYEIVSHIFTSYGREKK